MERQSIPQLTTFPLGDKQDIIAKLQQEVYSLQRFKKSGDNPTGSFGLGVIEQSFPEKVFPVGAVHEFISYKQEEVSATNGFISGVIGHMMKSKGTCLWISARRTVYPPALKSFGISPERIIFIDVVKPKDVLWAVEEALKCGSVAAVVGELSELSFTESRRLQLAVENSHVTGFIHRYQPRSENTVACLTRWKIKPFFSSVTDDMPGVGFPAWDVQLQKVRNGIPGRWYITWDADSIVFMDKKESVTTEIQRRMVG